MKKMMHIVIASPLTLPLAMSRAKQSQNTRVILRLPKATEESNADKILRSPCHSPLGEAEGLRWRGSLRMTSLRLLRRHSLSSWLLAMTASFIFLFAVSSFAEVYITADEATKNIFPNLERYEEKIHLIDNQEVKVFTVFKGDEVLGWTMVLDEMGKNMPVTFLIGIDRNEIVLDVYMLEFRDLFGSEIKRKSFLKQFRGKSIKDALRAGRDIDAVTGATISSRAATMAVKKALEITARLK